MTPDEWASLYSAYLQGKIILQSTPQRPLMWEEVWTPISQPVTVVLEPIEAEGIEHPSVVGYFDHLYAQELGIAYP